MRLFKTPVIVEPGVLGRFRVVLGPTDALEVLTARWPDKESPEYQKALGACRAAEQGKLDLQEARRCFVAAAQAARVHIPPKISRKYTVGSVNLAKTPRQRDDRLKPSKREQRSGTR